MSRPGLEDPRIEVIDDVDVDESLDAAIRRLLVICFPHDPRFLSRRFWQEPPARRWFIRAGENELAAHVAVHRKRVGTPAGEIEIGGIAEVCVHPDFRGRRLVRVMLERVHQWLRSEGVPFAMLFGNRLVYASSGYMPIFNPVRHLDAWTGTWKEEPVASAMVRALSDAPWPEGVIDLRGPTF